MLIRIRIILQHLTDGQRVTAGQMARLLDVSQRTIARDFDYMINALDLPIKYEFILKSYILDGPLPSIFSVSRDGHSKLDGVAKSTRQRSESDGAASPNHRVNESAAK